MRKLNTRVFFNNSLEVEVNNIFVLSLSSGTSYIKSAIEVNVFSKLQDTIHMSNRGDGGATM